MLAEGGAAFLGLGRSGGKSVAQWVWERVEMVEMAMETSSYGWYVILCFVVAVGYKN